MISFFHSSSATRPFFPSLSLTVENGPRQLSTHLFGSQDSEDFLRNDYEDDDEENMAALAAAQNLPAPTTRIPESISNSVEPRNTSPVTVVTDFTSSPVKTRDDIENAAASAKVEIARGTQVRATVLSFGPLGASVSLDTMAKSQHSQSGLESPVDIEAEEATSVVPRGLIIQKEIRMFEERRSGEALQVGECVEAWVERRRDSGRYDVSLRPVGRDRATLVQVRVIFDTFSSYIGKTRIPSSLLLSFL